MMKIIKDEGVLPYQDEHMRQVEIEQAKMGRMVVRNDSDVKYSTMIMDLVSPYLDEYPDPDDLFDKLEIAKHAWNMANAKQKLPDLFDALFRANLSDLENDLSSTEIKMLEDIMDTKTKNYFQYDLCIADIDIKDTNDGMCNVVAVCQTFEEYVKRIGTQQQKDEYDETQYESGYVDRSSVSVKPKQVFIDWVRTFSPDESVESISEIAGAYLVKEMDNDEDVENWLKKNFDKIFTIELEEWCDDKRKWPQHRSYKMFRDWFEIQIHSMVLDLEDYPVVK